MESTEATRWLVPRQVSFDRGVNPAKQPSGPTGTVRAIQPNDLSLVWLRPELAFRIQREVPDDPDDEPFHPEVLEAWLAQAGIPAPPRDFAYFVSCPPGWADFDAWHVDLNACIATTEDLAPARTLTLMAALLARGRQA